jgi:type 1 glutamine amidotransferase
MMKRRILLLLGLLTTLSCVVAAPVKLKVLLVTGGHGFERSEFLKVFDENKLIEYTHAEHTKDKGADVFERPDLLNYDVVVLYDMPKTITERQKEKFKSLFAKGTGLVVLHHALCSYQQWPEYEKIIGGRYQEPNPDKPGTVTEEAGYQHDVEVPVQIAAKDHPITGGVGDFTIHDEIYWGFRVGNDVTPLLKTSQPKSGKTLAWTKEEGKSRVVYLQLGHGPEAYQNPNYRKLVANSIFYAGKMDLVGKGR